ncbi:hypothetical protein [Caulobacter sp. X]|uniref:hypothetical protein n=1 Tax=Caulobacter sp. X TaxID=2048901 RepID=UPI000C150C0D|nr:hypothetical protein [Caulobacter sp. X]PIB95886.1 hypothetical protein CSW60_15050 [Caulobacter sp. X]
MSNPMIPDDPRQTAIAEFEAGPVRARAEVSVTPAGVLAIGALITGLLLSTAAIVWAARRRR